MTNYQPYRDYGAGCAAAQPLSAVSFGRFVYLALARWRERKRVKADLARLAEVGDHLLLDIGLDPRLARQDPTAALDQISNDRENRGVQSLRAATEATSPPASRTASS